MCGRESEDGTREGGIKQNEINVGLISRGGHGLFLSVPSEFGSPFSLNAKISPHSGHDRRDIYQYTTYVFKFPSKAFVVFMFMFICLLPP